MLLNAFIAWNLSSDEQPLRGRRKHLSRHGFYTIIAQCLLNYEPTVDSVPGTRRVVTINVVRTDMFLSKWKEGQGVLFA